MVEVFSRFKRPPAYGVTFEFDPGQTVQSAKDECDINSIMARYAKTGFLVDPLKQPTRGNPTFGDFTAVPDFYQAQQMLADATEAFESLPSAVRKRFSNDPGELIAFLADEKNQAEAVKLGLAVPSKPKEEAELSTTSSHQASVVGNSASPEAS